VTGGTDVDTLVLTRADLTDTSDLKAGANVFDVKHNAATDISSAALSASGGTLGLVFDGTAAQNITMTSTSTICSTRWRSRASRSAPARRRRRAR